MQKLGISSNLTQDNVLDIMDNLNEFDKGKIKEEKPKKKSKKDKKEESEDYENPVQKKVKTNEI